MSIYVLVHGGLMGGWGWRQVANYLRAAGHEVFTPTLTGYGERAHLVNRGIDLHIHIEDVVGVLECEDLYQVILVGHSYGGMVITGVAERVPERLSRLVYLDAIIPKDGQSQSDLFEPEVVQQQFDMAKRKGDGWRYPIPPGLEPPRWQPMPLKTITDHLEIKNPAAVRIPRAFIHCMVRPDNALASFWPGLDRAAEEAKQKGWWYRDINAEHAVMFTMPKELAELLLELA